ncbi:MAG: hypothetical protein ACO3JU_03345 [Pseudohongiellaceae bacterium]
MFRAVVYHVLRFARYFFWASVLVVMNACVTTTTGGFNVEPSDEESLENYIQLAVAYFDANDMPNARRHLNNALEIDSRNSEAYNFLGLISHREGDLELAIENFSGRCLSIKTMQGLGIITLPCCFPWGIMRAPLTSC